MPQEFPLLMLTTTTYLLSVALKHYLTGNLTSMDYWILTGVLFLGWFAIWMCTSFWDLKSPGLDLITVINVLRLMGFFSIIYWLFWFSPDTFGTLFPSFHICTPNLEPQRRCPSSVFSFVHIKRHFQVGNFLPSVYILSPSVQHVIGPQRSTLVSQIASPEAATPVFSL